MPPPTFNAIGYDVRDRILTITLNRPEQLNAADRSMCHELVKAFDLADADDEVRVVIVTGAGRVFCAGKDISNGAESFSRGNVGDNNASRAMDESIRDGGGLVTLRIFDCIKPVIGAINGAAVGMGATVILPMDIRLASETAKFGYVFARRGIVADGAAMWFLPRAVGVQTAAEWIFSGRLVSAAEALAKGLVRSLHKPEDLLGAARELAAEIVSNTSAVSVALMRQMMWRMLGADHPMEAHKVDSRAINMLGRLPDAKEGVTSFLEKRLPQFTLSPTKDMPSFYPWWKDRQFS